MREKQDAWLKIILYFIGIALFAHQAFRQGASPTESRMLEGAMEAASLIEMGAKQGIATITGANVDQTLMPWAPVGLTPTFFSGYLWLALARRVAGPWMGELTALRMGNVLLCGFLGPLVFSWHRRYFDRRWSLVAAFFTLLAPSVVGACSVLTDQGWMLVVFLWVWKCYADWLSSKRTRWAIAGGVGLGLSWANSWFSLWILVVIFFDYARHHRISKTSVSLPSFVIYCLLTAMGTAWLSQPLLWRATGARMATAIVHAASPVVELESWGHRVVTTESLPLTAGFWGTISGLSSLSILLILLALYFHFRGTLKNERSDRWLQEQRGLQCAGWLVVFLLVVPIVFPSFLRRYPDRYALAVPWLSTWTMFGLRAGLHWLQGRWKNFDAQGSIPWSKVAQGCVWVGLVALVVVNPTTLPSHRPWLVQGLSWLVGGNPLPTNDGSIIAEFAPYLSKQGAGSLKMYAPQIPSELWGIMHQTKRLKPNVLVVKNPEDADFALLFSNKHEIELPKNSKLVSTSSRFGKHIAALYRVPHQ
jgi:hypothetical protein